jgi:hypothetical protein
MGCNQLFLTGLYRSGTTLLDKLLHAHPRISVASQPCSVLFTGFKQRFLTQQGLVRRYPLDDLFGERGYQREDLHEFLDDYCCTEPELREWMEQLSQPAVMFWRRVGIDLPRVLRPGTFSELLDQVHAQIREAMGKEAAVIGAKEIVCEEFISYLLQRGKRVLVVIRDPRDVICSTNYRRRSSFHWRYPSHALHLAMLAEKRGPHAPRKAESQFYLVPLRRPRRPSGGNLASDHGVSRAGTASQSCPGAAAARSGRRALVRELLVSG